MPYIIDGHNLIPKISGIALNQLDDEQTLIATLDQYFKKIRKKAIVYFDHAFYGTSSVLKTAFLQAHFIHKPSSADEAILIHLKELGGNARNFTIITSDNWIADSARSVGAAVISSDDFAHTLHAKKQNTEINSTKHDESDIEYWMKIFQGKS